MSFTLFKRRLGVVLAVWAVLSALTAAHAATAEQTRTTAQEAMPYTSAFEQYTPWVEPNIAPWPAVNDTVRTVGGWRSYAREAAEGHDEASHTQGMGTQQEVKP
ncbi:hypothetical protein NQT62_03505 [Limnobacter humi]|uniref:Uncharacterized protein n=1 Tax=Limnobacter humi TaxID=1778671 RepID=A0ABT1WEN7_9BURK|nr:hypothetical protein [Limnobacter humi]MCQ8895506.1 hypothetical protein [Limnobacter humi]